MSVKFVEQIKEKLGVSAYTLGKMIGVTQQTVRLWTGVTATKKRRLEGMNLRVLCKLRKVSGLSWSKFGRELDKEFLDTDSD